jgi:hypothetical protein
VPPNDPVKTADKLFDFYTKKIKLDRPDGRPASGRRRRDSLHFATEHGHGGIAPLSMMPSKKVNFSAEPEEMDGKGLDNDIGPTGDGLDPNTAADRFVTDIGAPFPAVHPDSSSPSEDFFTIGKCCHADLLADLTSLCNFGRQRSPMAVDHLIDERQSDQPGASFCQERWRRGRRCPPAREYGTESKGYGWRPRGFP